MTQNLGALVTIQKNHEIQIHASAARTATPTAEEFSNPAGCGLIVRIKSTAITATPSVVFTIQGWDPGAEEWYDILASAAVTTGSTTIIMRVHPELTASANLIAKDILPRKWRVNAVHADADSISYSCGAIVIS